MFDWLRKRFGAGNAKEEAVGVKYVLKRQGPGGGMRKVAELAAPSSPEELTPHLEPGVYALDMYKKGQSGFGRVWGPIQVLGEEDVKEGSVEKRPTTAGFTLLGMLHEISKMKEQAKEEYMALRDIFEEKTITADDLVNALGRLKEQYEKLDGLFGAKTSSEQPVKYKGEMPIWMHPKGIPQLIDNSLDAIERRLSKWGLIVPEGQGAMPEGPIMKFPEKPKPKPKPKEEDSGERSE